MSYENGEAFYVGRKINGSPYIWNTFGGSSIRSVTSTPDNIMTFFKEGYAETWAGTFIDMEKRITIPSGSLTLYIRMKSTSNTFPVLIKLEGAGSQEIQISNTVSDTWETIPVTFTSSFSRSYPRLTIFPGFGLRGTYEVQITAIKVGTTSNSEQFQPVNTNMLKVAVNEYTKTESNVTKFSDVFNDIPIGQWNTNQITNMFELFKNNSTFNDNIQNWDVTNVDIFDSMFENASNFDQKISFWNIKTTATLNNMVTNSGLSIIDQYNQGFKNLQTPTYDLFNMTEDKLSVKNVALQITSRTLPNDTEDTTIVFNPVEQFVNIFPKKYTVVVTVTKGTESYTTTFDENTILIKKPVLSNTLIYYKPNSLPSCGVGSTTNSRAVSRRT